MKETVCLQYESGSLPVEQGLKQTLMEIKGEGWVKSLYEKLTTVFSPPFGSSRECDEYISALLQLRRFGEAKKILMERYE